MAVFGCTRYGCCESIAARVATGGVQLLLHMSYIIMCIWIAWHVIALGYSSA